ncbi:hypothetical protein [Streptomyces sp. NPDC051001]|uniref:ATP-dependent DNA ligase n=1 Tax=Streptomyces sp. NPDC051001 TaxID=3155795 RepID=UPI003448C6D4
MAQAFPEIEEAVRRLPDDTAIDCELIVWEAGRLAFDRLQQRMHRRGAAAARAALAFPAHLVAFDLLRVHGQNLTGRPFSDRYAALQALFLEEGLAAPWSLCPTTTDPEQAATWLVYRPSWERSPAAWRRPPPRCWAATTRAGACGTPTAPRR